MASPELGSALAPATRDFEEHEIKHLEIVQSVIARMAQNSFHIKGWSVTVATGMFALSAKESSLGLAILALFPAVSFWFLDTYYLRQERLYRRLYAAILDPLRTPQPFSMRTEVFEREVQTWTKTLFAKTIFSLHGAILFGILVEITAFLVIVGIRTVKP